MRPANDQAVSTVIGAIVVLAVLGTALVYVNAYHVPKQGAALESAGAERTEEALLRLATTLAGDLDAPVVHEVPLQAPRGDPPLLAGIVLTPARATGTVGLDLEGPVLRVSALLDAPATGVPANDPIRKDEGGGKMRLYLLGNQTAGTQIGAFRAVIGGAYVSEAEYRVEGGMVLANRSDTSAAIAPPGIAIARGAYTTFAWRIPILAGTSGDLSGASIAQIGLQPGPDSALGGGHAYRMNLEVNTTDLAAWRTSLEEVLGASAIVNATQIGATDNGTIDAVILPPVGTLDTERKIEMQLWAVRYQVTLAERSTG